MLRIEAESLQLSQDDRANERRLMMNKLSKKHQIVKTSRESQFTIKRLELSYERRLKVLRIKVGSTRSALKLLMSGAGLVIAYLGVRMNQPIVEEKPKQEKQLQTYEIQIQETTLNEPLAGFENF